MATDRYRVLASAGTAEIKVKGSRFLCHAFPVQSAAQADDEVASVRKRFHDATHHCYAYRVGPPEESTHRSNDDGEPSGTAGQPILRQIDAASLTDTLVVVTRYYGGTKLGTGGLARAYAEAARTALQNCPTADKLQTVEFSVVFDYDDVGQARHAVTQFGGSVVSTRYEERTAMVVAIPKSRAEGFCPFFKNAVGGRGTCRTSAETTAD